MSQLSNESLTTILCVLVFLQGFFIGWGWGVIWIAILYSKRSKK